VRSVVFTVVFWSIQVLWDMPRHWVSGCWCTFKMSGATSCPVTQTHIPNPNLPWHISMLLAVSWGSERWVLWRQVRKYSAIAKCTGTVMRVNIQYVIDNSNAVEFNTSIMLVLLASDVMLWFRRSGCCCNVGRRNIEASMWKECGGFTNAQFIREFRTFTM
jgi:hypothetical protein